MKFNESIKVYFETESCAILIATFSSEELYIACFSILEEKCHSLGYKYITESFDTN
jgi:hypothetical protein